MRCTGIRKNDGSKIKTLDYLCSVIVRKTRKAGFITEAKPLTSGSIKIGLHMSSFRIDTNKLVHNARIGRYIDSPKGYKRTNVPTWDQRVEFNDLVNKIFDDFGLIANIKSGPYTVRSKTEGAQNEQHWENETPEYQGYHGESYNGIGELMSKIVTESEAREECDSDRLEAEHKENTRIDRLEQSREYRARIKAYRTSKRVKVAGFYSWNDKPTANGKLLTHAAFNKMLNKLSGYEQRRVKQASIKATAEMNHVDKFNIKVEEVVSQ